jgi:2'-5' RNA ligase
VTGGAPIDATAYDRFGVVAFGTPEVVAAVESLRSALPPSGRPNLPGHVTVKGTFVEPQSIDTIAEGIRACCAASAPFTLTAERWQLRVESDWANAWLEVDDCPVMTRLHEQLVATLADLCTTTYFGEAEGIYRPHLTLAQEFPPAASEVARAILTAASPQFTFPVADIALVGRRGGTTWETIRAFPLSPGAPS